MMLSQRTFGRWQNVMDIFIPYHLHLQDDNGVYAAFNRDYLSDDVINSWDGSIDGIYQILKASEWDNSKAPGFQYLINEYVFGDMIGCEIRNGLCFDYDTMSVEKSTGIAKVYGIS